MLPVEQETKSSKNRDLHKISETVTVEQFLSFKGPIPPPDLLAKYPKDVRAYILSHAQKEQLHRHKNEDAIVRSDNHIAIAGTYITGAVCVLSVIGGVFLVAIDKDGIGIATILVPVIIKGIYALHATHKK